jgi:anti-sigma regulatory factor (Ser/Thr protein kinase)
MRAEMALACDPRSVAAARRFVTSRLAAWGHPAMTDTAALLVSELVTNALLHARSPVVVAVSGGTGCVRVEVTDGSPVEPRQRRNSLVSGTGRGLVLVERLARGWGAERREVGKAVWFELGDGSCVPEPDLDVLAALDEGLSAPQAVG